MSTRKGTHMTMEPRESSAREATLAIERIVRAERELDAIRCLFALNGSRSEIIELLYQAEATLWMAIDVVDPGVRILGWKSWLEEQEER